MEIKTEIKAAAAAEVLEKVAKLNKRAAKLGCAQIRCEISAARITRQGAVCTVVIAYDDIVIGGYTVVAKIEHTPAGNVIANLGMENAAAWTHAPSRCEHCNTTRRRAATYILRSMDGDIQVGKTCLKDYTGHDAASALAGAEIGAEIRGMFSDLDSCGGSRRTDLVAFVAAVIKEIAEHGYEKGETGWRALGHIRNTQTSENELVQAVEIAEKMASNDEPGDYWHNVRTIAALGCVASNHINIIASAVPALARIEERARATKMESVHVGTIGQPLEINAILVGVRTYAGNYGQVFVHRFQCADGALVIWQTNREHGEEGKTYTVRGTVKAHNLYRGVAETHVTRAVLA